MDILLCHSTYFGDLMIEYFRIKFIFSNLVLLSKYHFTFMNRHENKKVIQRLISSQIGVIFDISPSFYEYYFTPTTNPYTLITQFYTDFGSIQQIAFPTHHTKTMSHCLSWQRGTNAIDWDNVHVVDTDNLYYNPYDWQYNAIQYDQIPFDFVTLIQLKKAECLIYWLQYIVRKCDCDLYHISLNTPSVASFDDEVLNWKCEVLMITAINDHTKVSGGFPLYLHLIRNICDWPCDEFVKAARFIIHSTGTEFSYGFEGFLCDSLRDFCLVEDFERGCENYCMYLDEWSKHKLVMKQTRLVSKNIIRAIDCDVCVSRWNLYQTMFDIICEQSNGSQDVLQSARCNAYYQCMFGRIGAFLRKYVRLKDLKRYLKNVTNHVNIQSNIVNVDADKYWTLFVELLGIA